MKTITFGRSIAKSDLIYILAIVLAATIVGWGVLDYGKQAEIEIKSLHKQENVIQRKAALSPIYKEEVEDMLVVNRVSKSLLEEKIEQGKEFLYRMEEPGENGFHKYYYAESDTFEDRVHTVYSASIIYTFLYLNDYKEDPEILSRLQDWGDFLLSMQDLREGRESYGAFHYSLFLDPRQKEERFVVGTAALSIFTLLRLEEITGQQKYLDSAHLAGDWLVSMQDSDGKVNPYLKYSGDRMSKGDKESLLYEGQVLSSLSKLYSATGQEKYLEAARKIADRFAEKYRQEQGYGYIEGDYRKKNPISNSWVVMSLMDFYKAAGGQEYKDIVFQLSSVILENQYDDSYGPLLQGRWRGAYSSSGNGWISEVMTDTYRFCLKEGRQDCKKYKDAVAEVIRWLIQHTYGEENSQSLPDPETAKGGVFWKNTERYVRTDSVCHALNGYVRIFDRLF